VKASTHLRDDGMDTPRLPGGYEEYDDVYQGQLGFVESVRSFKADKTFHVIGQVLFEGNSYQHIACTLGLIIRKSHARVS
jgi:hypothetical protein